MARTVFVPEWARAVERETEDGGRGRRGQERRATSIVDVARKVFVPEWAHAMERETEEVVDGGGGRRR